MNKLVLGTTLAALCGSAALALPALAQTSPPASAAANAAKTPRKTVDPHAKTARAVPAPGSRNCLRSTGSLIPPPKGQCLPVPGTSYSGSEIRRTGYTNIGQALQMLDPSVTVHGR